MTLEEVMMKADFPNVDWGSLSPDMKRSYTCHANAVRAFLGSEEVVEAAASAIAKQNDGCEWSQMSERAKQWEIGVARAALSSIGGE